MESDSTGCRLCVDCVVAIPSLTSYLANTEKPKSAKEAAERLRQFLDPKSLCERSLLLMIAFDEAASLLAPETNEMRSNASEASIMRPEASEAEISPEASKKPSTLFPYLRCALKNLNSQPFFTLFMSTSANIQPTSVAVDLTWLQKSPYEVPFPPITAVPFDIFANKVVPGTTKLEDLASIDHMAHLGRPLYVCVVSRDIPST